MLKTNKRKIKYGSPNPPRKKNDINDNNIYSYRTNSNNHLLKSNSLKENIKIKNGNTDKNKMENKENNIKVIVNENKMNNNINKFHNFQKSMSQEYIKDLMIENDCLFTDNNILENYSHSTTLGENLISNKINSKTVKNIENNNESIKQKIITDIKHNSINNNDFIIQNSLICPNNFNKMFKNIIVNSNEENKKIINNKDISMNKKESKNEMLNDINNSNSNTIRQLKTYYKKNKSFNKIIFNNDNNSKKQKNIIQSKTNLKNNINNINNNNSLIKDNLLEASHTLYDFYNCKLLDNIKEKLDLENTKINKDISLKEIKLIEEDKNICLKDLLITKNKEEVNEIKKECDKNEEHEEHNIEDERIRNSEFSNLKKDYDLFYSLKFIESIQNDLLDLEFNLALDKSISLFILYNKEANYYYKRKKELINIIKNYMNKNEEINKKMNILNTKKRKNKLNIEKKKLINDSFFNYKNDILSQKMVFEKIINPNINKKEQLQSIITSLMKNRPSLLDKINNNKENIVENEEEKYDEIKMLNQSPSQNLYLYKSQKIESSIFSKKESKDNANEIKNKKVKKKNIKGEIINNKKLTYKKHKSAKNKFIVKNNINKNLLKNNSINNLLSSNILDIRNNINNGGKANNKESKNGNINNIHPVLKTNEKGKKNNHIYYSTARTNFYHLNSGKIK